MKNIIIITLLFTTLLNAQKESVHITLGIDPSIVLNEQTVDFNITFSDAQDIFKIPFRVGLAFEVFPKRDYYSAHAILEKPILDTNYFYGSLGVEFGSIFRDNVPVHPNTEVDRTALFNYMSYGVNGKMIYWVTQKIGIGLRANYKTRPDLAHRWGKSADKYRFSGYINISVSL